MSKLDTNFVKQLYSSKGVELTPEKLQYISENYASNEELESSFNMKYSEPQEPKTDPEKKNQNSTTTSTKTPSVSPTQQQERKPTSVGGKPKTTGASASSAGRGKKVAGKVVEEDKPLFGEPVQSFTDQKSKEFKEAKKKEIAVIDNKPVVDITSQFNVKPKTFTEAVSTTVDSNFKDYQVKPLSLVVSEKQKERKASQQDGLDDYLTKESIDFEDALANKGFLNNVENFARDSWNTALALASNLPFGIGEKASEVIGSTGIVADKTSVDKYFTKAKQEFEKEGKSVTPERLKERAKEIRLKEAKDNYIENQDAEFLNEIKDEEYLDPKSGEVTKIQDALRINDFEKYNTLNKESVKYSNLLKLNKEKLDGFYNDLKQTKNVLNHQIIFGNFDYATDIYNGLLNKEDKNQDDLDFISYYETNKDKAASSPVNPNLKEIVSKLEEEIKSNADDFNSVLDTQLNYIEKFDKSFTGKEDAYEDFDNSRRSYDGVFGYKFYSSFAETVNGTIKTIQTLAELSDKLKSKIGLPLQGADSYLFNKVFKDYNYYDFSKELEKQKELVREDVKEVTNASSLLNYVSDVTATQTGQMTLPMLAGYGGLAMPLLSQSAVYFASGFGRGVGESEKFEERLKRGLVEPGEIGKVHTFAEKLIHGGITGGADILGNLPTALRLSKSFNSLLSKPNTANIFWKSWTKKGLDGAKEFGTDLLKENTEESLAEIFQDLSRVFVLNEDGVNIGQSIDDVIKDTTTFTLISKIFPLMGRGVINRIASTSDKNKISELEKELYYWKGKLGENVSEETKAIYSDRISKIQANIDKTNLSIIDKVKKDAGGVNAIESLNTEIDNTLQEANKINENKELSKEEKKVLLDAQKKIYTSLISNRDALIDGSKTSFDLLPEEEQTKLKVEAAEAIIQEQVDKGIEKDNIQEPNAEVINKKAKELYNQKIQEDAKTKQTDGKITNEEKPTTTNKEQAVSTAQQKSNVELQEEVDNNKLIGLEPNGGVDANVDKFETYSGNKFEITLTNVDENGNALPRGDGNKKITIKTIKSDGTVRVNNALTKTFKTAAEAKEYANKFIEKDQQKDKNTNVKKEVDKLRAEELNELTENVENPEDFITDGKVDAKKVSESDNAKAKEIYAKYDAKIKPLLDNIKTQEDAVQKQEVDEINKKRAVYGLEPLKPTYRGTSISEWESVKKGEKFKSKDGFGENKANVTWVSDKKEYSEGYITSDDTVLVEFKPEAIDKSTKESGQENDDTGVRLGRDLDINDVQKVTDSKGNIIYESPKAQEDAVQKQSTNEGVLQSGQSEMGLQEMEQGDAKQEVVAEQGKEKIIPGKKSNVSGVEITYPTEEEAKNRREERSKPEYIESSSKDLIEEDVDSLKEELDGDFGLLTAENPMAQPLTEKENSALNKKAEEWLKKKGYSPRRVVGKYGQAENSFFVPNLTKQDAVAFAKEFNQESVAHSEGLIYQDGSMNPRVKSDDNFNLSEDYNQNSDYVSVVKTKDGLKTFSVGYDFNQRVQPETSQGIEVSNDINEAKKQVANIANKKIARSILNGVKAISKILPNVKVIIHDTDASFRSVSGESKNQSSSGLYQDGKIHINLEKANRRTVAHEIFHAILLDKVKTDANAQVVTKKMIEAIAAKIDNNPKLKAKLEEFASMYDENIQNEEKLSELVGMLAENYDSFSTRVKEIIKNWLNSIAKSFGVELFESNEVFDVLNTIAKKVSTGKEISKEDVLSIGEENMSVSDLTSRFQANFKDPVSGVEFVYDKNTDKFIKLEKDGFITKDKSINDFDGKILFLHQPDAAFSGLIFKNGELLVEGKGGVYYPIKFHEDGYFWASTDTTAENMAKDLNKVYDANNGKILMALTTAPYNKLLSSTTASNGVMEIILSKAFDKGFSINKEQIKKSLIDAANKVVVKKSLIKDKKTKQPILDEKGNKQYKEKNFGLGLKLKKGITLEEVKSEIKNKLNPEKSSFDDRKIFSEGLISNIASIVKQNPKAVDQFGKFFSKGIKNESFKGVAKTGKLSISAANMTQAISEMLTEPMLKEGVDRGRGGQVYAILELNGKVKDTPSNKHESYPKAIQSVDPKNNKVKLHILKDRVKWNEVFEDPTTNEIVSKDRELNIFPTSGVSTTGLKLNTKNIKNNTRQQKALPSKVAEKLTEDGDGNFVFKHYSDQKRDVIKTGQGNNAITSREEASALSAVGGLAMFYTMEGQKETGVGNVEHNILISKDKVYDIDSDPLGFEKEAKKRFNEVRPGQAFTNNHRGAFITQIANENGFDIAVTQWRGSELRAQTTKELTPSDKAIDFKERPLDTFKDGDYAIIDGRESLITNVDGNKLRYESLDGIAKGTTVNNERNRRSIIKIDKPSVRMQKPKKLSTQINKVVGIKPKATEQKRINKAYDIGVAFQKLKTVAEKDKAALIKSLKAEANAFIKASITDLKAGDIGNRAITSIASKIQSITDQNFEEKLLDINTILDNLYTNRDVNTAKDDSKNAFDNVMSGKVGKLDKRGDRDKVMSSKIVNFTKLEPKILKRVLDDADFEQYKDYISRLSGRGLTLEETDLPTIEKIFDKIVKPYSDYVAEVNRIQQIIDAGGTLTKGESDFIENNKSEFSERETPQTLADKEAKKLERDAKKEAEIAKKKASIKELLPSIKSVFESSNAVKGSLEWRILDALIGLSESDVDSMPDNMLTNALNAISSMVNDDVIPSYAEDLYKYKLKTDYKNALVETLKKAGKFGVYKLKVAKIPLKIREIIGLPLNPVALWNDIRKKNITQKIIDRRIKLFNLSSIDAAVKVYGDTPLFNAFMSSFGKAMSRIASAEEKVEAVLLKAKRDLDKNSKNPQESYMKIVYHLIDTMAKNNVGTTSSRSAMEYFEATVNDPNSKISEDNYMKGLVEGFIKKVGNNNNQIEDLTPEEANAANAIRMVLEENQINAYEANLFQNSNAAPMIVEYFPVFNSVVKQAENDLARLKSKFGIDSVSIKAGSLEDKTGTAHPIDLNPFTSAFSSVRNVLFQHQLRSEYAAITQAINEAIAENSTDNDVLPYLKGIQKALNSQFDLLINGAIHTEPTLTDKILNGTDRAFYTLALGSIISRGVDFAGNMVQLMTINPKYISYSNKISNALINIKEDGESETELIRSFYENAEASDINKMISSKKINTERTEFINKGINKEVLSKGLPESNIGTKIKSKITGPIRDTASGAVDTLLGFGDVKPYAISWNGVFYEEFLKQAGEEVNIEKIARGDIEYLKKYKDAISKASNKANQENADLYGSTNPMEKKVGIMEIASKKIKNSVPGAVNALVNKAAYLFASFDMNARNDMNTAVNTYIENQEGRNARRFLGGAIRLASYSLAINYITGAIWGWLKGDDDDEEKLKVSFDKLSGDDDFIKEVNNFLLDYPIQKDADGNIIELNVEDLAKYDQIRYKLMQNKDFAAAYDIIYGYLNRDLFDNQVKNKIGEINNSKYEYDKSFVEVFFSDIDKGFGKSDDEIVGVLGLLNSQQGYKLFTEDEIDSYILKIEKYMADTNFLSNRATRESSKQIDKLIVTKAASILSDYRSNKSAEEVTTTEGLKLFMGMMFSRSNNFTKASYNFAAEFANKQMIQSRRGERGYDAFKDNVFQTPIKAGLTKVAIKKQLTQDAFNILFPALTKMDKYMYTDYAVPDLVRFTPLGILGVNDFSKIDSKMKNDVIYQNTNGKYRDNIIKDIKETKIDILRSKENIEKDSIDNQFRKSRVIPGVKETKLKSRLPSYKEGKDLKVNGNRAN
ncbi:structural protein [Flavobacterium phage vB_FspP_elemoD_13-5B]|uniref:Structural protein n=1 Tax=Flavobacterium phage vB_FspP_elemoD_13-5B TaxID=2743801 RepID=A0A7D7IPN1_9CAUD|nr:structural protein [Flavobacterium phage vB_FspP_elemoD_13-5B]QMP87027.1 structural protein [Flavobacterium phage vB_FspP_elemoD_13-5B]